MPSISRGKSAAALPRLSFLLCFFLPLPPSLLCCFCPLLSAAPDKQTAAFAWRRRARRHLLPLRKAGESALIPLALASSSSLLHAPPHLKSIAPRTSIPPPNCSILSFLPATPPPPPTPLLPPSFPLILIPPVITTCSGCNSLHR